MHPRRDERLPTLVPCELSSAGADHVGTVLNISRGGLFAETEAQPALGSRVEALLSVQNGDPIALAGTVAHLGLPESLPLLTGEQGGFGLRPESAPESYFHFLGLLFPDPSQSGIEPSIRGAAFERPLEQVRLLRDQGWITQQELEARLEPQDFAYLDQQIGFDAWYPVTTLGRFLDVLLAHVCEGIPGALVTHCQEVGREILDSGDYAAFLAEMRVHGAAGGKLLARCAQRDVLNFSRWDFAGESLADFRLLVSKAGALGESLRHGIQGALQLLLSMLAEPPVLVESLRVNAATILFQSRSIH